MSIIVIIAAMVIITLIVMIVQDIKHRKQIERYLKTSYGNMRDNIADIPDMLGNIEALYLLEKERLPEDKRVDDITWNDLDMDSIFALTDHTDSFAGEQYLYAKLHDLSCDKNERDSFEKMIQFFDKDADKRLAVRRKLSGLGKAYINYDIPALISSLKKRDTSNFRIYYILCAVLIVFVIVAIVFHDPQSFALLALVYVINMFIHSVKKAKMDIDIRSMFCLGKLINTAFKLRELIPDCFADATDELDTLKSAANKASYLEQKNANNNGDQFNLIISYLLGPFMIDFIIYGQLVKEFADKNAECIKVLNAVGKTDSAIAVASYRNSLTEYCIPEFSEDDSLSFTKLVHPAIANAVPNDFVQRGNVMITGSNASGKSTFIKSAAINLILGQTINTCTAEKAVIPKCGVITSMAVRDDITSGESYYIREIKYLKRMIELCRDDRLLFLAIDEILKGTNTVERIAASKAILRYFNNKRCILIVATHDLELARTFDGIYDNYYFSEVIGADDVVFDYKMHKGISSTSNAIKLLRAVGFPDDILTDAEAAVAKMK